MEKKYLITLLDEIFFPLGYKRKGNNWVRHSKELTKIINLQKSAYGDLYYINYGFIINELELTMKTHIEDRLAGSTKEEQSSIANLLDMDYEITREERLTELEKIINKKVMSKMSQINTKDDILNELKRRPFISDIPINVKRYFGLI